MLIVTFISGSRLILGVGYVVGELAADKKFLVGNETPTTSEML